MDKYTKPCDGCAERRPAPDLCTFRPGDCHDGDRRRSEDEHRSQVCVPECPICGEAAVLDKGGMTTLMGAIPFVGEDGKKHDHDPNTHTGHWVCPNKHEWREPVAFGCSCGWKGTPYNPRIKIIKGSEVE